MKKFIKIGMLSFALIASLLLLVETTNAAPAPVSGQVSFDIVGGTNTQCTYGTSWNLGSYTASMSAFVASGNLTNFTCTDIQGFSSWAMTLQATTPVSNGITSIDAINVKMQATPNTVSDGICSTGTNTTELTSIGSTGGTIMIKTGMVNQICSITTSGVTINIDIPSGASIGTYTGTLSLTLPW